MADIFNLTDTWNDGGTRLTAIKMNVTDTASEALSMLLDLQVGGSSKFLVRKSGQVTIGDINIGGVYNGFVVNTAAVGYNTGVVTATTFHINNSSVDSPLTYFTADAANVFSQRNGTNAQTLRTYGTYTDSSNYRRVALAMTTAGVATLAPEGAGTGASGNVLHISGLPTSNPGPGILWNNAGTPAIGT